MDGKCSCKVSSQFRFALSDKFKQMPGVYSEIAPPVEIADRLSASFPHHMSIELNQRRVKILAKLDK